MNPPDKLWVIIDPISKEVWGVDGWAYAGPERTTCLYESEAEAEDALDRLPDRRFAAEIWGFRLVEDDQ